MIKYIVISLITLVLTITILFYQGIQPIKYSDYKDVLSALLNISSILFAIIGAWIAIIYPNAIGKTFSKDTIKSEIIDADKDAGYLSDLVEIVLVSAIVLMFVLAIQFFFPIIKGGNYFGLKLNYIKIFGFYLVFNLTMIQLYAIFRVIVANYKFLNNLRRKIEDGKIDDAHV